MPDLVARRLDAPQPTMTPMRAHRICGDFVRVLGFETRVVPSDVEKRLAKDR